LATGTYGGPIESQAAFVNEIAKHCDAVVVNTADMAAESEGDDVWQATTERLLELTGSVHLGLYECPVPYKRLLSPALIQWCAASGRFHFHKDTCCNMPQIKEKIAAVRAAGSATNFRFYNANVETLLPSLRAGGHGFSGISANFYPHLHAWLCKAATSGGAEEAAMQKVQDFLSLAEATVCVGYPASAKVYLHNTPEGGRINTICRKRGADGKQMGAEPFLEHQLAALSAMWRMQHALSQELNIECPPPPP